MYYCLKIKNYYMYKSYIFSTLILLDFNINKGEGEKQVKKYEPM